MEGKIYKVSFTENLSLYNIAVTRISEIQEILNKISTDINNIIETDKFTGAAADNIKTYAAEIHLPLISAVSCMLCDYQSKLLLYQMNYFNIDDDYMTKFNAETMDHYQKKAIKYYKANAEVSKEIETSLDTVADIVDFPNPSMGNLGFDLLWMSNKINTLDTSILEYENLHSTDLDSLAEFITNLETFITYYKESVNPGEYQSGDCSSNMYAYQLYESMKKSQEFLKEHEAEINAAGDKLKTVSEQMQADYDAACQARIDQGRAEIIKGLGIAIIGGIAIVASGGIATPLVAGAVCMTGTCVVGYGLSNACEGANDVYYGMQGDLSSYAFNPLRDTIFMGNQQVYDIWGQANIFALSVLLPASSAYSEALAVGATGFKITEAVSVAVAKEMVVNFAGDQATGYAVDYLDQHVGLNETEKAVAEFVIGAALDPDTYKNASKLGSKIGGKPDTPNLSQLANETLLPDNEICFTDFMSADDAARYNKWSADCANGTHNNFPGLKEADVAAWKFGEVKLNEASVIAGLDVGALKSLTGESVKVGGVSDVKATVGTAKYRELDATENLRIAGKKAGCSDKVVEEYISTLESGVAKSEWGSGWEDLLPDEKNIVIDMVKDEDFALRKMAKSKNKGAETLLEYKNRYDQGYFDTDNYSMDDIIEMKMNRNADAKPYTGIANSESLPRADEFISDSAVVDYVKTLCPENDAINRCTNLQELANELHDNPVRLDLISFQDASVDGANILTFNGNYGIVDKSLESGGGVFSIPKSKLAEFASNPNYKGICSYENGVFTLNNPQLFGQDVLSGVSLSNREGAYMISTKVPLDGSHIGMPSVNNIGSYMDEFVSGGKLLSGELEVTQKPLRDIISHSVARGSNELVGTRDGVDYVITILN